MLYNDTVISGAFAVTAFQVSPGSMVAMFTDITEPKRMEKSLRESGAQTRWILENEPMPMAIVERDGMITFRNGCFSHIIAYIPEEIPTLEERWQLAYPDPEYRQQVIQVWDQGIKRSIEEHTDIRPGEYKVTGKNGGERILEISGIALGEGYLGTFIDLTEKKRAEEAIQRRLVALTQPLGNIAVAFYDLFDLYEIQRLKGGFAKAKGASMLLTQPDGTPIPRSSNFSRLCSEIIRRTPAGREKCYLSDSTLGRLHVGGPLIHTCPSAGLWGAGAIIVLGGKHIANWLIGQVRNGMQTDEEMRGHARDIGVYEEDFIQAFREVPLMASDQFERIAQALYKLVNQISQSAYQIVQQARFITGRRKAEEVLQESERKYRGILGNMQDTFILSD